MTPDAEPPQPLATVGGRFLLVEQLASDEHREVWLGHDDLAARQVVVKRLLGTDGDARIRIERRARRLEALSDPGIASVLAHDADAEPPWIATAFVEGETTAAIVAERGLGPDDALAVIGQAGLALASAHSAGVGHGRIDAEHIQVRPDGSIALIGFVSDAAPAPAEDVAGLGRLAHQLLDPPASADADLRDFLRLLDAGDWDDANDIGRTALALAAAQRAGAGLPMAPAAGSDLDTPAATPRRPWYDETERKRVRNRLIALGAIVVIGGAILLRIFTAGAGNTSVPNVVGVPYVQAQHDLNEVGLRGDETVTTGPLGTEGTVIAQDPRPGQQARVGSVVQLTVAATGGG